MVPLRSTKLIKFALGQRVLFGYPARRPMHWLSGAIGAGPKSKRARLYYQVKLDNGESRWQAADQLRKADL